MDELPSEGLPVAEEVKCKIDEFLLDFQAIELGRGDTVVDELAEVLGETTTYVQESVVVLEPGDDGCIGGLVAQREVDEAELSYAGPGEDFPDLVTLRKVVMVSIRARKEERQGLNLQSRRREGRLGRRGYEHRSLADSGQRGRLLR